MQRFFTNRYKTDLVTLIVERISMASVPPSAPAHHSTKHRCTAANNPSGHRWHGLANRRAATRHCRLAGILEAPQRPQTTQAGFPYHHKGVLTRPDRMPPLTFLLDTTALAHAAATDGEGGRSPALWQHSHAVGRVEQLDRLRRPLPTPLRRTQAAVWLVITIFDAPSSCDSSETQLLCPAAADAKPASPASTCSTAASGPRCSTRRLTFRSHPLGG